MSNSLLRLSILFFYVLSSLTPLYTAQASNLVTSMMSSDPDFLPDTGGQGSTKNVTEVYTRQALDGSYARESYSSEVLRDPITGQRALNPYHMLGFSNFNPNTGYEPFQKALRADIPYLLKQDLSQLNGNKNFERMLNNPSQRESLFRQIEILKSYAIYKNLTTKSEFFQRTLARVQVLPGALSSGATATKGQLVPMSDIERLRQSNQIRASIDVLSDMYNPSRMREARNEFRASQKLLNTAQKRGRFGLQYGLTTASVPHRIPFRNFINPITFLKTNAGQVYMEMQDPSGKRVQTLWPAVPKGIERFDVARLSENLRNGTVAATKQGSVILMMMYAFYMLDTSIKLRENPDGFKEIRNDTLPLTAAGISYMFAGSLGSYAIDASKNLSNLQSAVGLGSKTQRAVSQSAAISLKRFEDFFKRSISYSGILFGIPVAKFAFIFTKKMKSCVKLMNEDALNLSENKLQELRDSCNQNWKEIGGMILKDPKTWLDISALMSAKFLLTLSMDAAKARGLTIFKNTKQRESVLKNWDKEPKKRKISLSFKGLARPTLGFTFQFAAFTAVFYTSYEIFDHYLDRFMNDAPLKDSSNKLRQVLRDYQFNINSLDQLCENEGFSNVGSFWHNIFVKLGRTQDVRCGHDLISSYIGQYKRNNIEWRKESLKPFYNSWGNWNDYLFKALNQYRATKLLYSDIIEQIRVAKKSGEEISFEARTPHNLSSLSPIQVADPVSQAQYYNHQLPLFRSEPLFGWKIESSEEDSAANVSVESLLFTGLNPNWEELYYESPQTEQIMVRLDAFHKNTVPQIISKINSSDWNKLSPGDKATLKQVITQLESGAVVQISQALESLNLMYQRELSKHPGCAKFSPSYVDNPCFFNTLFKDENLMAKDVWFLGNENHPEISFKKSDFPPGFSLNEPFANKPLAMGQRYLMEYDENLKRKDIETTIFTDNGYKYKNMTDYLLKQMICGADVEAGESLINSFFQSKKALRWMGFGNLEFKTPRIGLKGNVNPCEKSSVRENWPHGWPGGWKGLGIYSYIEDSHDSSKNYAGIVEFLYNEVRDDVLEDFDSWWKAKVQPDFEKHLQEQYEQRFLGKIINGTGFFNRNSFTSLVEHGVLDNNCDEICSQFMPNRNQSINQSIKQELDTYFTYHIEEVIRNKHVSFRTEFLFLENTDESSEENEDSLIAENNDETAESDDEGSATPEAPSPEQARELLFKQYSDLRSRLYDIIFVVTGQRNSLKHKDLQEAYDQLYQDLFEETALKINLTSDFNIKRIELEVYRSLALNLIYEMSIHFSRDSIAAIETVFNFLIIGVLNNPDFTDEEKETHRSELLRVRDQALADYRSMNHRAGKIIISYPNDPPPGTSGPVSPSNLLVEETLGYIHSTVNELFDTYEFKYMLQGIY